MKRKHSNELTKTEKIVFDYLILGLTNQQIADIRNLSDGTAENSK